MLHLIPPDQRRPLVRRLLIVWAMALVIALLNWSSMPHGRLDYSLLYSYAISTCIWLLTDVPRFVWRGLLRSEPPHYWPPPLRAGVMVLLGIVLGYVLGTALGDAYAGHSTWGLLWHNQGRFTGMVVSSVAISLAFLAYFYQRSRYEAVERQAREAQLLLLQSQLQPHMLFNTLAHLRALMAVDVAQAQTMLDRLDDYLRSSLQASRQSWHSLAQELARIDDYLALMALRMGPRLQVRIDVPEALRALQMPCFILQPLVENAIAHGLEPKVQGGNLQLSAQVLAPSGEVLAPNGEAQARGSDCPPGSAWPRGAVLQLTVQDSGLGCVEGAPAGYGLTHVRDRLQQLFGSPGQLSLGPAPGGGCRACLSWPLAMSLHVSQAQPGKTV